MSKSDESLWLGNRRNIVVVLRLIVFSIIYLIILQARALGELPPVFWVATGAFLLTEIICLFEYKNYFLIQRVLGWIFVFDAALISLLIYLLGVKSGQLFIGYFAVIAIAAIAKSVSASFVITFLVSAFYLFASIHAGNFIWLEFMTRTLFFFGVAIFASYLSQEVSSQREEKERVKKMLEHSEDKYINLLANPLAGVYQSTLEGEFIYANPALADMLGYDSPKELMRIKVADTYANPANRDAFIEQLKKRGSVSSFVNELKTKSGQIRHVLTSGALKGEAISGVIMDITERKEMEKKLIDSEEQYRTVVNNTENLIAWVDQDGKFLFVNPVGQRILGLKPKDCIGKSAFDFIHPDDREPTITAFQKWLASKEDAAYFENRQVSVKGAITQMSWIIKSLRDDKNNVIGFLSIAHDITRRKKAEEQLRKSYESIEQILEHSPSGTFIIGKDKRIRYANQMALRLTGFKNKEELIGQICHKFICPAEVGKCPVLDLGQQVDMSERTLVCQGGQTVPILKSVSLVNFNGEEVLIEKFMDITERKRAEEALRASEEKYRDLFDNANDLIQIVSPDGLVLYANKNWRQALGYTESEAANISLFDIIHPDSREKCRELFGRILAGEPVGRFETKFLAKDSRVIVLEGDCSCRFENGRPVDIRGIFRDITERKQASEVIAASEVRYHRLFEAAKDGILILDFQTGLIIDANPFLTDLLGFPREQFLGKELWQVGFFKDIVANKDNFAELQRKKYIRYENLPLETATGEQINVEFVSNVYDVDHVKVIQCNIRDITERKKAEKLLAASEAQFKTFFENAPIGMAILNIDGSYVRVNESFCAILGYTPEELYKTSFDKLTHPDDIDVSRETIDLLLKNKIVSRNFNKRYFHKNGAMVWAEVNTSLLHDTAGQPLYFIIQIKDVTAGIEAEQSLKMQSELLDNSTDSIVLHDAQGRFIYANKATYQTRGYAKDEFLAMTLAELDKPEDVKLIKPRITQIMKDGRGRFEVTQRRKDGSIMPVEVNVSTLKLGQRQCFLAVMRDMTEQRQIQEQTQRNADTQTAINILLNLSLQDIPVDRILNETLDIILSMPWLSLDSRGSIFLMDEPTQALNMRMQRGLDPIIQKTCASLELGRCLCGKAAQERKTQFASHLDKEHTVTYKGIAPHGHYCVPIHTRDRALGVINIYIKAGHSYSQKEVDFLETIAKTLAGIISRQEIIMEKNSAQSQLLQAQKMEAIGTLSGGIAHDFNNILAAVRGYAELSMMDKDKTDPLYENLKHVVAASDRGKNLTNQLLIFSRKQTVHLATCDVNGLINNLLKMLSRLIGENFHIETRLDKNLRSINADIGNLEQVFMNLVLNARDSMPKGGQITIKTENTVVDKEYCEASPNARPGDFVCLSVADAGVGMTKEIIDHIFEPFFTTKEQGKGTGLGLSVVYGIIKQHQGWINVYSETGKGSVFKIYLPASEETAKKKPVSRIISPADFKGQGERILVLEDDTDVQKLVISVLTRMNYRVFPAGSLAQARQVFEQEKGDFQMILSDMTLPDGNGLELCDELTARNKNIKVLLSSGYPSRQENRDIIRQRGLPFLAKPYNLAMLFKTVHEVLESKQ